MLRVEYRKGWLDEREDLPTRIDSNYTWKYRRSSWEEEPFKNENEIIHCLKPLHLSFTSISRKGLYSAEMAVPLHTFKPFWVDRDGARHVRQFSLGATPPIAWGLAKQIRFSRSWKNICGKYHIYSAVSISHVRRYPIPLATRSQWKIRIAALCERDGRSHRRCRKMDAKPARRYSPSGFNLYVRWYEFRSDNKY